MNRRDFLNLGAAAVALPVLSNTVSAEPIETEDASYLIGLWENELWGGYKWNLEEHDLSLFAEAQQFADEPHKRIVSAVWKKVRGMKTIHITYLEPTSEKYPIFEEED